MLSRQIEAAMVVACLLHIPAAVAQRVVVEQFPQEVGKNKAFVLAPDGRQSSIERGTSSSNLASDFAEIGAANDPSVWAAAPLAQGKSSTTRHRSRQWLAIPIPACPLEPYRPNPVLPVVTERRRATWFASVAQAACEAGIPVNLFDALVIAESRYNPAAMSPKGAAGLAQLMPESARRFGVGNVWDPDANLRGGAHLLRALLDEFGRFDLALAAYNAGAGRVRATGQVPRIPETVRYVSRILITMRDQLVNRSDRSP